MEYICPICYGCGLLKNKSRHVKTKRHIQALNNKKMINNRFTNHNVSAVYSSFENQKKSDVSEVTEIDMLEDRFSPDSKFYQDIRNKKR